MKLFRSSTMARFGHRHSVSAAPEVSNGLQSVAWPANRHWLVVAGGG